MTAILNPPRPAAPPRRRRRAPWLVALAFMAILAPVVLFAGAGNPPCTTTPAAGLPTTPTGASAPGAGMFAAPLEMRPHRWYRVGATEYGGGLGSSGLYLPSYPDTFAELSLLDTNPYPHFTFQDGNALSNLPYGTAIRVANGARQKVLIKRDVGYGQGPGQPLPYRIDVYEAVAPQLGITKTPVDIELAPSPGTGATLGQLPTPPPAGTGGQGCPAGSTAGLKLSAGGQAQIQSDGSATAPASAPRAVKLAIAAANQIHHKPYPDPVTHYDANLGWSWPAYDCSGAVSYVLYKAGLHSITAGVSGDLEAWGTPGPGKWITVYANSGHTFIDIAGRAFDTADYGGPNLPAGSGPRWRQNPTGNLADGLAYVARHPTGL